MPPETGTVVGGEMPDRPLPVKLKPERRKKMLYTLAFVVGGAILGFAYHKLVGCRSGACPITASPYISTIYGALVGFLAGGGLGR